MDHDSRARSFFFNLHLLCQSILPSSCSTKSHHRKSLIRTIASKLPLGPAKRLHLHPDIIGRVNSVSSETEEDADVLWKFPSLVSLADIPWLVEETCESGIILRVQMYLLALNSTDSSQNVVSNGVNECCCQCQRPVTPFCDNSSVCDSGLSADSRSQTMAVDPQSLGRIAEMEAELSQLRQQLAMLVMAQEQSALKNELLPLPRDMTSSPITTLTPFHKSSSLLSNGISDYHLAPPPPLPPPPPPPPPPPSLFVCTSISIKDIVQQNKINCGKSSSTGLKSSTRVNMDQVLKDIGTVQLRKIARSPGGTPLRTARDTTDCDYSDPATLIARALRKKFASHNHVESSPGSESATSPGSRSACWSPNLSSSPDTQPTPLFGRHLLKPATMRNAKRLSSGTTLSAVQEEIR